MNTKIKILIISSALINTLIPINTLCAMEDSFARATEPKAADAKAMAPENDRKEELAINDGNASTRDGADNSTAKINKVAARPQKKQKKFSTAKAQKPMMTKEEIEALFNETPLGVDYSMTQADAQTFFDQCAQTPNYDKKTTIIKQMLQKFSPDTTIENDKKTTLLIHAIENNYTHVAQILIELGADVNKKNRNNTITPFTAAIATYNSTIAALLIKQGAQVDSKLINPLYTSNMTPLMKAASLENIEMVKILIQLKADVNAKQALINHTPLSYAARKENDEIVTLLIMEGAHPPYEPKLSFFQKKIMDEAPMPDELQLRLFSKRMRAVIATAQKVKEKLERLPKKLVSSPTTPLHLTDIHRLIDEYTDSGIFNTFLDGNMHLHNIIAEYAANKQLSEELALHHGIIQEIIRRQEKE